MTYYDKNALKLAHEYLKENVREGDTVVDATAGKGRAATQESLSASSAGLFSTIIRIRDLQAALGEVLPSPCD